MEGFLQCHGMSQSIARSKSLCHRRQALRTLLLGAAGLLLAPGGILAASQAVRESALDLALKAQAMLRPGAAAQAVQLLERALELEPGNVWTQGLLARALYLDNQPERALEQVEAVLATTPDDPMALLLRDQLRAGGEEADREVAATPPDWTGKRVVVLDPGHGGLDPGAVGPTGLREKDVALDIALRTVRLSRQMTPDLHIVLTRGGDYYVPMQARAVLANYHEADLFVSLHANAHTEPQAQGLETYRCAEQPSSPEAALVAARENHIPDSLFTPAVSRSGFIDIEDILFRFERAGHWSKGRQAAKTMQQRLAADLGFMDRGVHGANFAVLRQARMPALLVEAGFITNPREEALLATSTGREAVARSICAGLALCDTEVLA